jgi:hypothetical protein
MSENCYVYVNCPFDDAYSQSLDAILFTIVVCGFEPRSPVEHGRVCEPRIQRINDALFSSRYSIHDLSRCLGEGPGNLARFNMPLELGMAIALQRVTAHDWLALVPEGRAHLQFASNLAGFDLLAHDGTPEKVAAAVGFWLSHHRGARRVSERVLLGALPTFQYQRFWLGVDFPTFGPPWKDVVVAAREIAQECWKEDGQTDPV